MGVRKQGYGKTVETLSGWKIFNENFSDNIKLKLEFTQIIYKN
jgi:hypothetical protein